MVQKVIIKRATMKGDGAEGNPRGYFLGQFKIDGILKIFTSDYRVLTADQFAKERERGVQILSKQFRQIGDSLVISYDDDFVDAIDKQKRNFCQELIKCPDMRHFDEPKASNKYWTVEYGNEVSIRKAAKLADVIKVLNILTTLSYKERIDICFHFEPQLRPDRVLNSELFTLLGDTRTDPDTGRPYGVLINSEQRIKAVFDYFKNGAESKFRTTIYKAIEYGIIQQENRGYYLNKEFIGGDKESVYQYFKNMNAVFDRYILPEVAKQDSKIEDDDLKKVEVVSYDLAHNPDYESKSLEDLRAIAKNLGIKHTHVAYDKNKLISKIRATKSVQHTLTEVPTLPKELSAEV